MKKRVHPEIDESYEHHMEFYHPPLLPMPDIPVIRHYGSFLARRRYNFHSGVDLYAPEGTPVYAIEDGEVVRVRFFTGPEAGCSHWNTTMAVDIEGYTGSLSYGEITPVEGLKEGDDVKMGQLIGHVKPVLVNDKGKAMSMLHFAIHEIGWHYVDEDNKDPTKERFYSPTIDPTLLLIQLKNKADKK